MFVTAGAACGRLQGSCVSCPTELDWISTLSVDFALCMCTHVEGMGALSDTLSHVTVSPSDFLLQEVVTFAFLPTRPPKSSSRNTWAILLLLSFEAMDERV